MKLDIKKKTTTNDACNVETGEVRATKPSLDVTFCASILSCLHKAAEKTGLILICKKVKIKTRDNEGFWGCILELLALK